METAVSYLAAAFGVASEGHSFEVYREGLRHVVRVVLSKSFALLILEVEFRDALKIPDACVLTLTRERPFHRTAKRLGFAVEPELGDPEFDPQVYIATRVDAELPRALLDSPARRATVELLNMGFELVAVHVKTVQSTRPFALAQLDPTRVVEAFARLLPLARAAQRLGPALPLDPPRSPGEKLVIPALTLGFSGVIGLLAQSNVAFLPGNYPHLISFGIGLLLAAALVSFAAWRFRGRSTLFSDLAAVFGASFLAVPLAVAALLPGLNDLFAADSPRTYPSVVLQYKRPSRGIPELVLSPIEQSEDSPSVSDTFDYRAFERHPGEPVMLTVHQGLFGWNFIESITKRTDP